MGVTPTTRAPAGPHVVVADLLRAAAVLRFEERCLREAFIAVPELKQTRCRV